MFYAYGDLALIDPREPVLERKGKKGEFGQDLKEGCKVDLRLTLKPVALVPSPSIPSWY